MEDPRYRRSGKTIKDALLALMKEKQLSRITMSELARAANVSRSTLYGHFGNTQDVYAEVVRDFYANLRPLGVHLHCGECGQEGSNAGTRPFCLALRNAGPYLPAVRNENFLPTLFNQLESGLLEEELLASYQVLGLDGEQAQAVFRFQMSGCYAVALSKLPRTPNAPKAQADEWPHIQQALDTFIRGGIQALRSSRQARRL